MAHNNNCKMFLLAVDTFIEARPAQFITAQELRLLMAMAPPCHECSPLSTLLSPLTSRLYKIAWEPHSRKCLDRPTATVKDMFPDG